MALSHSDMPKTEQAKKPAMMREDICFVEVALETLGGKWTILLVHELMDGPRRFGELRRAIPEASAKMLTMRLRELETAGIVQRHAFAEMPPHVEYRLTSKGEALRAAIEELRVWGVRFCQGC
jgi:DNA-binding HxlR family transcriptional regulator